MLNIKILNNNSHKTLISWGRKLYVNYDEDNKYRKYNKILLRDPSDYGFLFGIPEYPSIELLINGIKNILKNNLWKLEYTISVGYSGGGHAAILYGVLLNIPTVKVCCPTTKIQLDFNHNYLLQKRYNKNPNEFKEKFTKIPNQYLDLTLLNLKDTQIYIYYTLENKYDIMNASYLKENKNVILIPHQNYDHFQMKSVFDIILHQ